MKLTACIAAAVIAVSLVYVGLNRSGEAAAKKSDKDAKAATTKDKKATTKKGAAVSDKVVKTDAEWKKELSPQAYEVLRQHGTERAFSGAYWDNHEKGTYVCAACGKELFSSDTKFESGTGWPSFRAPLHKDSVEEKTDSSYGMTRTEVLCARCGGHLGHVFDDGPAPTHLRYCMNSAALKFVKAEKK